MSFMRFWVLLYCRHRNEQQIALVQPHYHFMCMKMCEKMFVFSSSQEAIKPNHLLCSLASGVMWCHCASGLTSLDFAEVAAPAPLGRAPMGGGGFPGAGTFPLWLVNWLTAWIALWLAEVRVNHREVFLQLFRGSGVRMFNQAFFPNWFPVVWLQSEEKLKTALGLLLNLHWWNVWKPWSLGLWICCSGESQLAQLCCITCGHWGKLRWIACCIVFPAKWQEN